MLYGFSRDHAVPFWWLWTRVDDQGVPIHAGTPVMRCMYGLLQISDVVFCHSVWHCHREAMNPGVLLTLLPSHFAAGACCVHLLLQQSQP